MKCEQIQPNLLDYSKGQLSVRDAMAVKTHLEVCPACVAVLQDEVSLNAQLSSHIESSPTKDLWPEISTQLKQNAKSSRWFGHDLSLSFKRAVLAGFAVVFMMIALFGAKSIRQEPTYKPTATQQSSVRWSDDPVGGQADQITNCMMDL